MGRLESLLLIAPDVSRALFVSYKLNELESLVDAGIDSDTITQESLLQLPTATQIDLTLYSAQTEEDQLRTIWPRNTNTQFLASNTYALATEAKEKYREAALHEIALESEGADGFFAFIELYAVPLVECARALEEADLFPTSFDGYTRESTTDVEYILDKNKQALQNLRGYVKQVKNRRTTGSFIELLNCMKKEPGDIDLLCEKLVGLAAIYRENPPVTEGMEALLGTHYTANEERRFQ